MENTTTTKCFACDRKLGRSPKLVDTRDGQLVYIGSDCYKQLVLAGQGGWQPSKGGPTLYLAPEPSKALYSAARSAFPILKQYIEEVGGCDHSVGICCCDVIEASQQLAVALALNSPEAGRGDNNG